MREDEGEWQEMTKAGTVNQGDGLVEFPATSWPFSGGDMVKAKIELSGTAHGPLPVSAISACWP